jgi:hypothetical protein
LRACGGGSGEEVWGDPKAPAGKKTVFETGADHLFKVAIVEAVGLNCANVFVGEVRAGDAFIVCGKGEGDAELFVNGEGVVLAGDSEDAIVAGEIDFDQDVRCSELFEECVRFIFVHDVHSVADAFSMAEVDGLADVAAKTFIGNEAGSEFSGVEADVNFWIEAVKEVEHSHVERIVGHGDAAVFGHNEIQTDETGVRRGGFKTEKSLSKDDFARETAEDLAKEADLHAAC